MTTIDATPEEWKLVPEQLRTELRLWVEDAIEPSAFMRHVLRRDLGAALLADEEMTLAELRDLMRFLVQHCPVGSYGSRRNYYQWIRLRGRRPA